MASTRGGLAGSLRTVRSTTWLSGAAASSSGSGSGTCDMVLFVSGSDLAFAARLPTANADNSAVWTGLTRYEDRLKFPIFRCEGQFRPHILPFQEQTLCTCFRKRMRQRQDFIERC